MAFVGFRFGMRPVSRQASTTEAICAQLALMSRRFLKQLPRARTGFSERQARVAVACFLHRQNSQGQSIHAIFEQRGRLRIGVNERRHARPQSRTYAIFTSLTISNLARLQNGKFRHDRNLLEGVRGLATAHLPSLIPKAGPDDLGSRARLTCHAKTPVRRPRTRGRVVPRDRYVHSRRRRA